MAFFCTFKFGRHLHSQSLVRHHESFISLSLWGGSADSQCSSNSKLQVSCSATIKLGHQFSVLLCFSMVFAACSTHIVGVNQQLEGNFKPLIIDFFWGALLEHAELQSKNTLTTDAVHYISTSAVIKFLLTLCSSPRVPPESVAGCFWHWWRKCGRWCCTPPQSHLPSPPVPRVYTWPLSSAKKKMRFYVGIIQFVPSMCVDWLVFTAKQTDVEPAVVTHWYRW